MYEANTDVPVTGSTLCNGTVIAPITKSFWARIQIHWCKITHDGAINIKTHSYECPQCHRTIPYDWWAKDSQPTL